MAPEATEFKPMGDEFPMNVIMNEDGTMTIEWDENHPVTSIFNTWKEKDFLDMIIESCKDVLSQEEYDRIKKEHIDK